MESNSRSGAKSCGTTFLMFYSEVLARKYLRADELLALWQSHTNYAERSSIRPSYQFYLIITRRSGYSIPFWTLHAR